MHRPQDSHSGNFIPTFCKNLIAQSSLPASNTSKSQYAMNELDIEGSTPSKFDQVIVSYEPWG